MLYGIKSLIKNYNLKYKNDTFIIIYFIKLKSDTKNVF